MDEEADEKDEKDEEELREGEPEVEEGCGGCRQRLRGQVRALLLKTMSSTLSSLHGILECMNAFQQEAKIFAKGTTQ